MNTGIKNDPKESLWVDGLQRQVKLQKNRLKELMDWCSILECDDSYRLVKSIQHKVMTYIFHYINCVVYNSV